MIGSANKSSINKNSINKSSANKSSTKKSTNKNNNKSFNATNICLIKKPSMLRNNNGFPLFEYEGGNGFKTVKFILKQNEKIRADGGAMNYMSSDIKIETKSGSILNGFSRMLSGSSFFYNIFYNDTNNPRDVTFSGINPGNIGCFYIPAGKSFNIVSDSYICSTINLDIDTNFRFGGVLLGYGLTFVNISAKNGSGLIWGSSFGDVIEKIIAPGHSIKIDNGVLLGFEANIEIKTNSVGGIKSTLFSGEGFVSEIKNNGSIPMRIFLQSRSKIAYIKYIKDIANSNK
jgi:uncharacterized protein (TIGR00266 family)